MDKIVELPVSLYDKSLPIRKLINELEEMYPEVGYRLAELNIDDDLHIVRLTYEKKLETISDMKKD